MLDCERQGERHGINRTKRRKNESEKLCEAKCFLDGCAFAEGCRTYRKFVIQEVMKKLQSGVRCHERFKRNTCLECERS